VARGDAEADEAAKRLPDQDGPLKLKRLAKCRDVIDPGIEVPAIGGTPVAPPVAR
jgi:hypothetical protein